MSLFFFFKQKTAYELRISDWSSDVCSSDLGRSMKRPVLAPYSQTPIDIISFRTSAGETAFRDENHIIAGQKFAAHLAKRMGISREAEDQTAEAYGTIAAAHQRSMTKVFPRRLAFAERMKAIAQMHQTL